MLVLISNLNLSFTVEMHNTDGVISNFDIIKGYLTLFQPIEFLFISVAHILACFLRSLRNDDRKLTTPQNDLQAFTDLGCCNLIIAFHFISLVCMNESLKH